MATLCISPLMHILTPALTTADHQGMQTKEKGGAHRVRVAVPGHRHPPPPGRRRRALEGGLPDPQKAGARPSQPEEDQGPEAGPGAADEEEVAEAAAAEVGPEDG